MTMPFWLKSAGGGSESITGLLFAIGAFALLLVLSSAGVLPPEIAEAVGRFRQAFGV